MKKAINILAVVLISILCLWFSIYNGILFAEHDWAYSKTDSKRAFQYLLETAWGLFFVSTPILNALLIIYLVKKLVLKKK